jgi:hypothetical protein
MASNPDFDEDIPTGVHHLPQGAHVWAVGITRDVRTMKPIVGEIHDDIKEAKTFLKTLRWAIPTAIATTIGFVEVLSWALRHVKL